MSAEDNYSGTGTKDVFPPFLVFSYCYTLNCLFKDYATEWNFPHHVISKSGFDHCAKLESKPGLLQYETSSKTRGEAD